MALAELRFAAEAVRRELEVAHLRLDDHGAAVLAGAVAGRDDLDIRCSGGSGWNRAVAVSVGRDDGERGPDHRRHGCEDGDSGPHSSGNITPSQPITLPR